jgi:hypothetical protein
MRTPRTRKELIKWLLDLEMVINTTIEAMEVSSDRIEELENTLRGIDGICLDKDHEAAVIAIASVVRAALAPEQK